MKAHNQTAVPTAPSMDPVCPGRIPLRPNTASTSFGESIRLGGTLSGPGSLGRSISPSFPPSSHLGRGRDMSRNRTRSPLGRMVHSVDVSSAESSLKNSPYNSPHLKPVGGKENWRGHQRQASSRTSFTTLDPEASPPFPHMSPHDTDDELLPESHYLDDDFMLPPNGFCQTDNICTLSLEEVVGDKHDFSLQNVDPSFTDSTEEFFTAFKRNPSKFDASNSVGELCIEEYLVKSEKAWFMKFRAAKLGRSMDHAPAPSIFTFSRPSMPRLKPDAAERRIPEEFHLSQSYRPPRGFRNYLQYRIGDWLLYTILLALGQIMGANSYQITLISGLRGQDEEKFCIVSRIYLAASIFWWLCYRSFKSVHLLSLPFLLYGLSLLLLGTSPYFLAAGHTLPRLQNKATALYTIASASGSLYFALNFGDESGSPTQSWVFRACFIQGTQQIYICALWAWGSHFHSSNTLSPISTSTSPIPFPASTLLLISLILPVGLPNNYRQSPSHVPSLYASLLRRKLVLWFLIAVAI
jgi:alpha-1,3-glucan synthase